jgi:hypothetical protein
VGWFLCAVVMAWPAAGYVGWAWINHCAHLTGKDLDSDNERAKWHLLRHAPFWGPRLIYWHWRFQRSKGHVHFGLRFR